MEDKRSADLRDDVLAAGPRRRVIADCPDWSLAEYLCTAGPDDHSFEERHESFTIAAVVEGTFRYETEAGSSLLHPGSWLLGNHGECFACGHDHSRGDRCLSLHVSPRYLSEVATSHPRADRFRFAAPALPARASDLSRLAHACSLASRYERIEMDEVVTGIIESVVGQASGESPVRHSVSRRDERRISAVLHHLEDHYSQASKLGDLASLAAMSKYHFLRTFRGVVGRSPHQYLLNLRLRHAADRLVRSGEPIQDVALGCGFGDLSTFGLQFKRQFAQTPSRFRTCYAVGRQSPGASA